MMRFCVIAPCAGLQKFSSLTKTHLVLSQVENPLYWEFYRRKADEGDLVILDNGAYEGRMDESLLLLRAAEVNPQVVVLPDILGSESEISYHVSRNFWNKVKDKVPGIDWMFVPQMHDGTDPALAEMMHFVDLAVHRMQIKWIGLPRILATRFQVRRYSLVRDLKRRYPWVHTHALGMAAGAVSELRELDDYGCDSIDSSAPVWRGWNGYELLDNADPTWDAAGTEVNWDVHPNTLNPARESLVKFNLRKVGVKC